LVTHDAALKDGAIGGLVVEDWLDSACSDAQLLEQHLDHVARKLNEICCSATLDVAYRVGQLTIKEIYDDEMACCGTEGLRRAPYWQRWSARSALLLDQLPNDAEHPGRPPSEWSA
jgi:hypothetical protein